MVTCGSITKQKPKNFLNRISTRFFFCVKNMSRCVKYQESGEGVGVGFCHSCHGVKMHQKHLGFLEYTGTRGPSHNVQTDTSLVSDHTYQWGPSVSNNFSNLTNSPSPTRAPELQYTRDGTSEYVTRGVHVKRVWTGKYTIQRKDRKETRHASVLVWMYKNTNSIMWRYICTTRRESLRNEHDFFFWYLLFVTTKKQGIRPGGFFVYECVCLCVCARMWTTCNQYTRRTSLMAVHFLSFIQTLCMYMSSSR